MGLNQCSTEDIILDEIEKIIEDAFKIAVTGYVLKQSRLRHKHGGDIIEVYVIKKEVCASHPDLVTKPYYQALRLSDFSFNVTINQINIVKHRYMRSRDLKCPKYLSSFSPADPDYFPKIRSVVYSILQEFQSCIRKIPELSNS